MTSPGIYRHYKGGLYRVLFNATESTNGPHNGRELVVYVSLAKGAIRVRAEDEFHEGAGDGARFVRVGDEL